MVFLTWVPLLCTFRNLRRLACPKHATFWTFQRPSLGQTVVKSRFHRDAIRDVVLPGHVLMHSRCEESGSDAVCPTNTSIEHDAVNETVGWTRT